MLFIWEKLNTVKYFSSPFFNSSALHQHTDGNVLCTDVTMPQVHGDI